jgi:hypothetical protein
MLRASLLANAEIAGAQTGKLLFQHNWPIAALHSRQLSILLAM